MAENSGGGAGTAVARWGNSAGVRIPKDVLEQANLHEGDEVSFEVETSGVVTMRSVKEKLTLDSLVERITPSNRHSK